MVQEVETISDKRALRLTEHWCEIHRKFPYIVEVQSLPEETLTFIVNSDLISSADAAEEMADYMTAKFGQFGFQIVPT